MTLLYIDIFLVFASFLALIGTFIKNIARQNKSSKAFKSLLKIKGEFKRMIIPTLEEKSEKLLEKTVGSLKENHLQRTRKTSISTDDFLEMKKRIKKAEVYMTRGDMESAEKHFVEALSFDESHQDSNKKLALVYLKQKKYPKAELIYLKLIEQGTKDPAVYANLGLILYNQDRPKVALKAYLQSIELDPKKATRLASIAQIYYELQDIKNAIIYFEKAHILNKRDMDYLFVLARLYEGIGQKEKARYFYHKILNIEPYNEDAKEGMRNLSEK